MAKEQFGGQSFLVGDVIQEACLRLLRFQRSETIKNPVAYVWTVVRNVALDLQWQERRSAMISAELGLSALNGSGTGLPEDDVAALEALTGLRAKLPSRCFDVFQRVKVEGYTVQEAAREMRVSPNTVRSDLRRAEALIRLDAYRTTDKRKLSPSGLLYDAHRAIQVPQTELIRLVSPKIVVASSAIAERLKGRPEGVHSLQPRQFEQLIAEILEDWGWQVHLTPATRDQGMDILAYMESEVGKLLWLVEAKRYSPHRKVGFGIVQSLYGSFASHGATHGMLVTTSTFTAPARDLQAKHRYQLTLREYADVIKWIQAYGES
jgi:RNA polymerase sigma factor (sigma-70 family)